MTEIEKLDRIAVGADLAIRYYILYSQQLVDGKPTATC